MVFCLFIPSHSILAASPGAMIDKLRAESGNPESQFKLALRYNTGEGVEQDFEKAFNWCKKAADKNHIDAMYSLGLLYKEGEGTEKNIGESFKWFKKAAEEGHTKAQFEIGEMYYYGKGISKIEKIAFSWYEKAAEKDLPNAQCALGRYYQYRYGDEKSPGDYKKAFDWYSKAATQGFYLANLELGLMYKSGNDFVKQDFNKAFYHLDIAANKGGYFRAMYQLGLLYEEGQGVPQNKEKAFEIFLRAAKDDNNDMSACLFKVGLAYLTGQGVAKDEQEAFEWFIKSANHGEYGDSTSKFVLSYVYLNGIGTKKNINESKRYFDDSISLCTGTFGSIFCKNEDDPSSSLYWIKKIAEAELPVAQHYMGIFYFEGEIFPKDIGKSIDWLEKAAKSGMIESQTKLGLIYGDFELKQYFNSEKSTKWFLSAANNGDAQAQYQMCLDHYLDPSEKQSKENEKEAFNWCKNAAEQGYQPSFYLLGEMYYFGKGTWEDKNKAYLWLKKSADLGAPFALNLIGVYYEDGLVVMQDEKTAYAYYSLATSYSGGKVGKKNRDRLGGYLSKNDIEEGRKIALTLKRTIEGANDEPKQSGSKSSESDQSANDTLRGSGSGFIVSENGYIVTCNHVINGASKIVVVINKKEYAAKLSNKDEYNDIALLKIDGNFSFLKFAQSNSAKIGSDVFTIGFPNPALQGVNQKVTKGNINALTGFQDDFRLFEISVPVQPGNSGGPLLNENGEIIGIIVAVLKAETAFKITGSLPQNVNYALKSNYVQAIVDSVQDAKYPNKETGGDKGDIIGQTEKSVVMILAYN
jgi:TPR repeat protein/S1-C subfamily serine protease